MSQPTETQVQSGSVLDTNMAGSSVSQAQGLSTAFGSTAGAGLYHIQQEDTTDFNSKVNEVFSFSTKR